MGTLIAFVVTTWLLAMLPGVVQALLLRQTLLYGRRTALATIGGTSTGLLVWSIGAAGGLSALLLANETAYAVARWAGGLFLAYVGLRGILRSTRQVATEAIAPTVSRVTYRHAFATGLMTNLSNPKAGVFALSLLPQFGPGEGNVFLATAALGLVWALVAAAWYIIFVSLVDRSRAWVTSPAAQRMVIRVTGAILIALGIAVVIGH